MRTGRPKASLVLTETERQELDRRSQARRHRADTRGKIKMTRPSRRPKSFSITSVIRLFIGIGVAVIVSLVMQWQLTRHPYHGLLFPQDFGVRVVACTLGLIVSRFVLDRRHYLVIGGVVLIYVLMDAPRIESYFPFDPSDFYPFKFLPLMWAKIAWFTASVTATLVGSIIGERIGKRLRKRFPRCSNCFRFGQIP